MRYRVSYLMDEIWERAVETALDGQTDHGAARALTLDGAVKCVHGQLPPPSLLERFENLEHLSIANIGVSSLEQFPRLKNLQKLILSDNRIAGGLDFLVEAGLESLRDLDLSNNRIQYIEDLAPLAQLRIVSLDLYECPVTRVKDYRSRVFGMIKSLKYLDKMDAEENERPETDEEDEEDEDDPGSGEIDGEDRPSRRDNGPSENVEGIVDMDEEEESDADEEEAETARGPVVQVNGLSSHQLNGYHELSGEDVDDDEEGEGEEDDNESGEEIDEDDDVVEAYGGGVDSYDEEDGVEDEDDEDDDEDEDENEEEEVDNDDGDGDFGEPESTGRLTSTEGEIDGHEQGEEDGDGDGETGEEEQAVEDDGEFEVEDEDEPEEEDEDYGVGYLVQPVGQSEEHEGEGSDVEPGNEDDDGEEEVEDDDEVQDLPPSSSSHLKRKRGDNDDEDDNGDNDDEDDDDEQAVYRKSSSKKHH